jgi:hypothetical protein
MFQILDFVFFVFQVSLCPYGSQAIGRGSHAPLVTQSPTLINHTFI